MRLHRLAPALGALALLMGKFAAPPAQAADPAPIVMKITLPTINEEVHEYAKRLGARVEKDSGGRIKAEVYPASQLGSIPRQIEGVQFGSIQVGVIPPEFFVGVDPRFEIMAAPGLVTSLAQGQALAQDPAVQTLMLGLGAEKGLHGASLWAASPSYVIAKTPIRHLTDFKGLKLRVLASQFQITAFERLGATPVAMSLGDVLPAIQQGTIDGAVSGMTVFTSMSYQDAAKYVTTIGQPYIFIITEVSAKWRATLPKDLQAVVDNAAHDEALKIPPVAQQFLDDGRKEWVQKGGVLIDLPASETAAMMESMGSVAADVSKKDAGLAAGYETVAAEAKKIRQ
jgi:TRAP-type C4-dicarboxylate transport system substrate-binding protein